MADKLIKFKTGTIADLQSTKTINGKQYPIVPFESGSVYFAYDTTNHIGRIAYDVALRRTDLPNWNSSTTYSANDEVSYNNKNYISIVNNNRNIVPIGDSESSNYWIEIVERIVMDTQAESADWADALTSARAIDGVLFNGQAGIIHYGVCSTAANQQDKEITCNDFFLTNGARIIVQYTTNNSANNPTLKIKFDGTNYTVPKPIYYKGSPIDSSKLAENEIHEYIYDSSVGTNGAWVYVGTAGSDLGIAVDETTNTLVIDNPILSGDGVRY